MKGIIHNQNKKQNKVKYDKKYITGNNKINEASTSYQAYIYFF